MLVSGGKVIAIDNIKTNSATISGDGVWSELGLNTSAVIDPINNQISSLSSNVTALSGDVDELITNVSTISSNVEELSGKLDTEIKNRISADETLSAAIDINTQNIEELEQDVIELSGAISAEIEERKEADSVLSAVLDEEKETRENQVNDLSAAIDENNNLINQVSSYADLISAVLDEETEARIFDIGILDDKVESLSSSIDEERYERIDADEYLSAAIDMKQKQLSAGENILITTGDEYDTISVTGLKSTTYFAADYNRRSSTNYFTFDGNTLSANSAVGYFNLSIGYKVNTNNTIEDNYYYACVKVNNEIVDTHYINGNIPNENHYISKNVLNDSQNNLYTITMETDNGINISDLNITCIGYIGETDPITIGVLGTNGSIITFGGNTILRV